MGELWEKSRCVSGKTHGFLQCGMAKEALSGEKK